MKFLTRFTLGCILVLLITSCKSLENPFAKQSDHDKVYSDCMKTFQDADKCTELAYGKPEGELKPQQKSVYSQEQLDKMNLKICSQLFDELSTKNAEYMTDLIGEADEKQRRTTGETWYIYHRPVCHRSRRAQPERVVVVKVFRWRIFKVYSEGP